MADSIIKNENVEENAQATTPTTTTEQTTEEKPLTVADFANETKKEETSKTESKKEETVSTPSATTPNAEEKKEDNGPQLKNMTEEFISDVMSVPACSRSEYRMVTYIIMWARKHGIKYDFDKKGNIYLTKGELKDGEFYPCLTSHLDTVQDKQKSYAEAGMRLPLKYTIDTTTKKHKISVDGMGIGADCRAGIAISLAIMEKFDTIKAAFFLEEEIGMLGSKELDVDWFKNVGYVIGYDSPDLNRAAWKCSSEKMFTKEFFETHLEAICKKHGLTKFHDEPFTDVVQIRSKTKITCMNFGNGGYNAHMSTEYILLEDMDTACGMGIELVEHLGKKFYECKYVAGDEEYFRQKFSNYAYYRGNTYNTTTHPGYQTQHQYSGGTAQHTTSTPSTSVTTPKKTDTVPIETVKYISEKYDEEINHIKEEIKKKCKEINMDFDTVFASIFAEEIKF